VSVVYTVALTGPLSLGMSECIDTLHRLCEVATHMPHHLKELILIQTTTLCGYPKRDILIARGVFAVRFEFSYLSLLELADEARVLAPEEPDVLDVEKLHSPTLQTQAEGPPHLMRYVFTSIGHDAVVDDT
jgi:hypothetical protein